MFTHLYEQLWDEVALVGDKRGPTWTLLPSCSSSARSSSSGATSISISPQQPRRCGYPFAYRLFRCRQRGRGDERPRAHRRSRERVHLGRSNAGSARARAARELPANRRVSRHGSPHSHRPRDAVEVQSVQERTGYFANKSSFSKPLGGASERSRASAAHSRHRRPGLGAEVSRPMTLALLAVTFNHDSTSASADALNIRRWPDDGRGAGVASGVELPPPGLGGRLLARGHAREQDHDPGERVPRGGSPQRGGARTSDVRVGRPCLAADRRACRQLRSSSGPSCPTATPST